MSLGPEASISDEITTPTDDPAAERTAGEAAIAGRSLRQIAWRRFKKDRVALGGGIGPFILGAISDVVAAHSFPATFGVFSDVCPTQEAGTALAAACSKASAAGLRGGLMAPCVSFVLAGTCFLLSARAIREKLED